MKSVVVGCSGSVELARRIARKAKAVYSALSTEKFPDGETHLRFNCELKGKNVFLVQSLYEPNDKIIEVLFAAYTAKELGAKKLVLVAPYLAYMRQDKRFRPGECVSSRVIAELFSIFDAIITVDPHLHRYHSLKELFKKRAVRLSANSLVADYIHKHFKNSIIIGPDEESLQWAKKIAEKIKSHAVILKKRRYASRNVRIRIKGSVDLKDKSVIIVDDIISTGHTMIETVKEAKRHGAGQVCCICVHGIFAENAFQKLKQAGVKEIISTNTVPHSTNRIDVSGLIADAVKKIS